MVPNDRNHSAAPASTSLRAAAELTQDRSEIAFFDVETTIPTKHGQKFSILEFGAILVCPRKLEEVRSYSSLVRPENLSLISSVSVRCNGILPDAVVSAPIFHDIADTVYNILHGRVWAGHNIQRFDCVRIREAFTEIGRPPPEPKGIIDSLALLTQKFGRRAGDMKMATLAKYFGLGKQKHRSLDDVRMNLEVLKYCATVLFLESSLADGPVEENQASPSSSSKRRVHGNGKSLVRPAITVGAPFSSSNSRDISLEDHFDMSALSNAMNCHSLHNHKVEEKHPAELLLPGSVTVPECCSDHAGFSEPDTISLSSIKASVIPSTSGRHRMVLLHQNVAMKLCGHDLRVRFGLSTKFSDHAGRPRLSFVVDASQSLARVLDACDAAVQKMFVELDSSSDWRSVVMRKSGFANHPTLRLNIPTIVDGDIVRYATEMYQKDTYGAMQELVFSAIDLEELDTWVAPGSLLDACICLDLYDYHQNAGIRLVAKKVIFHRDWRK